MSLSVRSPQFARISVQRGKHELSLEQTHSRNKLKPVKTQYCQNLPKNLTMQTRKFLENPKILGVPQDCCAMFVAKNLQILYIKENLISPCMHWPDLRSLQLYEAVL